MKRTHGRTAKAAIGMALITMIGFGALAIPSGASAGTFDGTIQVSGWAGDTEPCQFSMGYSGSPGAGHTATMAASTFWPSEWGDNPCDPDEVAIDTDVTMYWGGSNVSATAGSFQVAVSAPLSPTCIYTVSSGMSLSSSWDALGNWAGSQSATSPTYPCLFAPATVTISDGLFHP